MTTQTHTESEPARAGLYVNRRLASETVPVPEPAVRRRLAAILAADVVGYSRLMEADEAGTLHRLKALRREVFDPRTRENGGRVFKTTGDGALVEFNSAVCAVKSATAIQASLARRNERLPEDRRIYLRIGISLGDVIVEGNDLFGNGVNVAARLEGLAEPGTVCISGNVHEHVRTAHGVTFHDMGDQRVKNIDRPIRAYRILVDDRRTSAEDAGAVQFTRGVPRSFGDRPSIAVLPFENLSGDPEQEYFADGIAEDILTRLAMWRWLPVIARNSSYAYKGRVADIKEIGRALGARYVLEGSVRRAGNRVRVTAQLIDAETGHHAWAQRYDGVLEDIFHFQDEITGSIVAALEPVVGHAEMTRAQRKDPENLDAWDLYQRGMWHFNRFTRDDFGIALALLRQASRREPGFAQPLSGVAIVRIAGVLLTWAKDPTEALAEAHQSAMSAISLDAMDPFANAVLGYTSAYTRQYQTGIASAQRSIELNPSYAIGYHSLGVIRVFNGEPELAADAIDRAILTSPNDDWLGVWRATQAAAHYMMRDYEKALELAEMANRQAPHYTFGQRSVAIALAQLGRIDEARQALGRFLRNASNFTAETARLAVAFRDDSDFDHYLDGLRKAGWAG